MMLFHCAILVEKNTKPKIQIKDKKYSFKVYKNSAHVFISSYFKKSPKMGFQR